MRLTRTRRYWLLRNAARRLLAPASAERGPRDDGAVVEEADPVLMEWPIGVRKPVVGLVPDIDYYPYWTKYRRFLRANAIPFEIFDIHRSSWLHEARRFDMVVWRPASHPAELEECRRKFRILEEYLGIMCYPSFSDALLYEDKILQYELLKLHDLPVIDTFVSHSRSEVLEHLATRDYPLVWKLTAGSGSVGVELARKQETAARWARRVFGSAGRSTYWPYVRQKDYVYLQRLVPNPGYDERVIVIGPLVFGYFRDVPKGEFRASGMKLLRHEPPSASAIRVARSVAKALDLPAVAVDVLRDEADGRDRIIEISILWQVDVMNELHREGQPGALVFDATGDESHFQPMRVWYQELALKRVLETRWLARERQVESASHGPQRPPL